MAVNDRDPFEVSKGLVPMQNQKNKMPMTPPTSSPAKSMAKPMTNTLPPQAKKPMMKQPVGKMINPTSGVRRVFQPSAIQVAEKAGKDAARKTKKGGSHRAKRQTVPSPAGSGKKVHQEMIGLSQGSNKPKGFLVRNRTPLLAGVGVGGATGVGVGVSNKRKVSKSGSDPFEIYKGLKYDKREGMSGVATAGLSTGAFGAAVGANQGAKALGYKGIQKPKLSNIKGLGAKAKGVGAKVKGAKGAKGKLVAVKPGFKKPTLPPSAATKAGYVAGRGARVGGKYALAGGAVGALAGIQSDRQVSFKRKKP